MKKLLTTKNFLLTLGLIALAVIAYFEPLFLGGGAMLGITFPANATLSQKIKGLGEQRAEKLTQIKSLADVAKETDLTSDQDNRYQSLKDEIEIINKRMAILKEEELRAAANATTVGGLDVTNTDQSLPHTNIYKRGGKDEKPVAVFTYYKKLEEPTSGRNAAVEFYKRNFTFDKQVADLTVGQVIRAKLIGPSNDAEERALSEGTASAGGYTVPSITSAQYFDLIRAKSHVIRAGAQTIMLDTNDTSIAKLLTDPTSSWLAENATITPSDPTFGRVRFQPKALKTNIPLSIELAQDSLNVTKMIEDALVNSHALELDRVSLLGNGTTEPKGIYNYSSPSVYSMGTNGAAITNWDPFVDCYKAMYDNNCPTPSTAIMAPRTWATINKLKDTTYQPLQLPPSLASLIMEETSSIPVNQDQGSATGLCSSVFFGGFENLMIGQRLGLTIVPTNYMLAEQGTVSFFAVSRYDVQPIREESFGIIKGIKI